MTLPSTVEHTTPCDTLVLQRLTAHAQAQPEPRVVYFFEFSVHVEGRWEPCLWLPPDEMGPGTRGEGHLADGRVLHVDIDDDMKVYLVGPADDSPFTARWSSGPLPTGARLSLCWTCSAKATWGLEISSPAVEDRDGSHGPRRAAIWCCTRHRSHLIDTLRRLVSQSRYPGRQMPAHELPDDGDSEAGALDPGERGAARVAGDLIGMGARVATRAEAERLEAVEARTARQARVASWVFLGAWATATTLALLPVITAVQAVAWAAGGAALVLLAVRSIRLSRASTARALAQSAVEEAEAMERIRGRAS